MRTSINRLAFLFVVAFCLFSAGARAGEKLVLHVYTWSDYFDPDVVYEFEGEFNCRVQMDYYDSNEAMYAKLKAGGGGYDVITPSSYMTGVMRQQGLVVDIDHGLLPNLENVDRKFLSFTEDEDMVFSVPYTRTVTGIGYNTRRVKEEDLGGWDIFSKTAYAKRMTMLNDMREALGAALKHLGHSLNTTDPKQVAEAADLLVAWKKNLAKFDVDEAKIGLGATEFVAVQAYNGDVALVMEENPDISFYIPREGSSLASDDFVITKGAPNPELAHAFINYMLDVDVALANMEGIHYYMPIPEAVEQLPDEMKTNPAFNVPEEVMEKCEVIRDLGQDNAIYAGMWDRVKAEE